MRLNTELAARAWLILGSSIVGVKIILRSVIHDFSALFMKLTKKLDFFFQNPFFSPVLVFHSSLLYIMGELAGGGSVAVAVVLVTGDRW